MNHIDISPIRRTSVTLRSKTRAALGQASADLKANRIHFSEQRLMRECLRFALKFWRGRREIAGRNRRYNRLRGPYEIVPLYTTEALRSAAWARCHHSGVSYSRLLDFAVAHYLPRVVEYWLRFEYRWRDRQDVAIWQAKYNSRLNRDDFVISYDSRTVKNDGPILDYAEKTEILPWPPPARSGTRASMR